MLEVGLGCHNTSTNLTHMHSRTQIQLDVNVTEDNIAWAITKKHIEFSLSKTQVWGP